MPTYQVTPMLGRYVGEHIPGNSVWSGSAVSYLAEEDRAPYRLTLREGKIYDAQNNLFDTSRCSTLFSGSGRAIFVMDERGMIYASKFQRTGKFHHSSLVAGGPVAAAGEIEVRNGVLISITDKSGHYRPSRAFTRQFVAHLQGAGVDTRKVKFELFAS